MGESSNEDFSYRSLIDKNYLIKMEIDIRNFDEILPKVQEFIKRSDFVSFDLEFSGLFVEIEDILNKYDSIEDQY